MKTTRNKSIVILFGIVLYIFLILVVSNRSPEVHNDSIRYKEIFDNMVNSGWSERSEIGFKFYNYVVSLFTDKFEFLFMVLYIHIILSYLILVNYISNRLPKEDKYKIYFYFVFVLSSTWYYISVVDGIRQGMSFPWLYLSCFLFLEKKWGKSLLSFLFSLLFHTSGLLFLPFFVLFLFNIKIVFLTLVVVSVFYPLGINEEIIYLISSVTKVPVYHAIKFYNDSTPLFYGFNMEFYLYTLFFSLSSSFIYLFLGKKNKITIDVLKLYLVFNVYFFVVGFAAFANRYAFLAWNFIPILIIIILISLRVKINKGLKLLILYVVSCVSISLFLSNFTVFKL